MFRIKLLNPLTNIVSVVSDILLYVVLFLVTWKFLWGVMALGLWENIDKGVIEPILNWPILFRMLIGLPLLIIVFSPVFLIAYWLFDEPHGLLKIIEIRTNAKFKGFLELIRKGIYCLAVFSVLKTILLEYNSFGNSFEEWQELLGRTFIVLVS